MFLETLFTMVMLINSVQSGTSARENTEAIVANLNFERSITEDEVLRSELNSADSLAMPQDSIVSDIHNFVTDGGGLNREDLLAYFYIEEENYAGTDSIIDFYNDFYEKENLASIIGIYKNLKQNGKSIYDIVSDTLLQQKIMEVVADSTREGYSTAIALLQDVFGIRHNEVIQNTLDEEERSLVLNIPPNNNNERNFILYPNPNNGLMRLNYKLKETEKGEVQILDITGRLITKYKLSSNQTVLYINQQTLDSGIYIYQIVVNGSLKHSDKIIINK